MNNALTVKLLALTASAILLAGCASGFSKSSCAACCDDETGFVSLFNGADLTGWTGGLDSYEVVDGTLASKQGGKGNLLSEKTYGDFILRFEYRLTPAANNGIAIRSPDQQKNLSFDGIEIQILDDTGEKYQGKLKDYQWNGSVYGVVPARTGYLKPLGEWNEMEIAAIGRTVKVVLNGQTIVHANLDEAIANGAPSGKPHPGIANASGHLGFLGHNDVVFFRNIRVKSLD